MITKFEFPSRYYNLEVDVYAIVRRKLVMTITAIHEELKTSRQLIDRQKINRSTIWIIDNH